MSAFIIDGKQFAADIRREVQRQTEEFQQRYQIVPGLAVVMVGDDPASKIYVRNKGIQSREVGFFSKEINLNAQTTQEELLQIIKNLNDDPRIHGILVQLPLPEHLNGAEILQSIVPEKDVDGFHPYNVGRLWSANPTIIPCTPLGCSLLIAHYLGDLSGKKALVIGRSNIVGKPMAALLLNANATVTLAHSRTADLALHCRDADIVIAAVGKANLITKEWIKKGAMVLDVGINRVGNGNNSRLCGDVDFDAVKEVAAMITPVPGGIGPMTIACLLKNTLVCAGMQLK